MGGRRGSNPRLSVPQTDALTNWATTTMFIECKDNTANDFVQLFSKKKHAILCNGLTPNK